MRTTYLNQNFTKLRQVFHSPITRYKICREITEPDYNFEERKYFSPQNKNRHYIVFNNKSVKNFDDEILIRNHYPERFEVLYPDSRQKIKKSSSQSHFSKNYTCENLPKEFYSPFKKLKKDLLNEKEENCRYYNDQNDQHFIEYINFKPNPNIKKIKKNSSSTNFYKTKNYFYKLLCEPCIKKAIVLKDFAHNMKKPSKKDKLNKCFNTTNSFLFQDKMNNKEKQRIQNKVEQYKDLQNKAIDNLNNYYKNNPQNKKDLLILSNEFSCNPLSPEDVQDEGYFRNKVKYDKTQKMIEQNKELYNFNQPRKEIQDYLNKCKYDSHIFEGEFPPSKQLKQDLIDTLKDQINYKNYINNKNKKEELKAQEKSKKIYNDYIQSLNEREEKERLQKQKELIDYNKKIIEENEKKKKNNEFKERKNEKILLDKLIKEEENAKKRKQEEKIKNINNLQKWIKNNQKTKEQQKKWEKEDINAYMKCQERIRNRCIHGIPYGKCDLCNRLLPKSNLYKVAITQDFCSTDTLSSCSRYSYSSQYSKKLSKKN